jgi:type IV pilus assembly protein PilA
MLLKLRERMASEKGFTLIELLVVMLIIGILAAIAIPTFLNQKDKATDTDSKAMAHTAQTAIETFGVDNGGDYTGAAVAGPGGLQSIEAAVDGTVSIVGVPTRTDYRVRSTSPTGRYFDVQRAGGTFTYPCGPTAGGGCPTGLDWGG